MNHNIVTPATVLSIKPMGENNASVCLLTKTDGILYAVLYGGHKSKLKSLVSTWNTGLVYLHFAKNSYKVSDFDVKNYHLSFRENIYKSCAASLAAELCIKTHCAGNNERCWALVNGFISGLDSCSLHSAAVSGFMRFLWRYLDLLGVQPDCSCCVHCGNSLDGGFYVPGDNGFSCTKCSKSGAAIRIDKNGLIFLSGVASLAPEEAAKLELPEESVGLVKNLVFYLIESACGSSLLALKTGAGIL